MTALTLRPEFVWAAYAPRLRIGYWVALVIVLAGLALPDCCLSGHHFFGADMESFGPICRAGL
jgi:hypothetical protein